MPASTRRKTTAQDTTRISTTLGELVRAQAALGKLLGVTLPTKLGYHLAKLGRLVEAETKVYQDRRVALAKELGEEREPTEEEAAVGASQMFKIKPEHLPKWRQEIATLNAIEVVLPWAPFSLKDVPDGSLSGGDIMDLGALLADDVEEKAAK